MYEAKGDTAIGWFEYKYTTKVGVRSISGIVSGDDSQSPIFSAKVPNSFLIGYGNSPNSAIYTTGERNMLNYSPCTCRG